MECQQRNAQVQLLACTESMWDDGICDENCRNKECGFNDCTLAQMASSCMDEQQASGIDYASAPLEPPGMSLVVDVAEPVLDIDKDYNQMTYKATFEYTLSWSDPRLLSSPCYAVLPTMLTRSPGEDSLVRDNFWIPDVLVVNGIKGANINRHSSVVEIGGVPNENGRLPRDLEDGLVRSTAVRRGQVLLQSFNFGRFPFDKQSIELVFEVPGTALSCDEIAAQLATQPLLPAAASWTQTGPPVAQEDAASVPDTLIVDVARPVDRCVLLLPIQRVSTVYIVQSFMPLCILVLGALMALQLNPTVPPMVGGRMSALIFAMVLVSLKSKGGLGIGTPTYLVWTDYFRLGQFMLLILGLASTVTIHRLVRMGATETANRVDSATRLLIPFFLYPLFVFSMVLIGFEHDAAGYAFFCVGIFALVAGVLLYNARSKMAAAASRRTLVSSMQGKDMADEEHAGLLGQAFDLFDGDKSGAIDAKELNSLFSQLFPKLNRKQRLGAIRDMQMSENSLLRDDFVESMQNFYRANGEGGGLLPVTGSSSGTPIHLVQVKPSLKYHETNKKSNSVDAGDSGGDAF